MLQTKTFGKRVTDAEWSPSRPGVFFIAKSDGTLDIWDLLDRTHAPILTQSISIHKLTNLNCKVFTGNCPFLKSKYFAFDSFNKMLCYEKLNNN